MTDNDDARSGNEQHPARDAAPDSANWGRPSAQDGSAAADGDYGFSGRGGFREGNYSGYYGRGTAGERDAPSTSGYGGAGNQRGGTDIPRPDREPPDAVRIDEPAGGAADDRIARDET